MRNIKITIDPHMRLGSINWEHMCTRIQEGLKTLDYVWDAWKDKLRALLTSGALIHLSMKHVSI